MTYIKAKEGPPNVGENEWTVQYFDSKGNMTIRSYGTRAWRCNNPGNLLKGKYSTSKDRRCIGIAGEGEYVYAIYPDYDTGYEASQERSPPAPNYLVGQFRLFLFACRGLMLRLSSF